MIHRPASPSLLLEFFPRVPTPPSPEYGADHMPCFTVCGQLFTTPDACKSSKEAQNTAAGIATAHPWSSSRGEKGAFANRNSVRGFDVVDNIKSAVEKACPGYTTSRIWMLYLLEQGRATAPELAASATTIWRRWMFKLRQPLLHQPPQQAWPSPFRPAAFQWGIY